ncbi:cytochrome c-type biogenesis protein CcmH [Spongiibacter sp. KMU-158]|uniref:Cytochrome c-type biogenesis protein n=1 Tax=Spongiibacter pelagi TaxID=2760804 RepID=A0A927C3Y4_9GAMM|nr:cytochrome c-type biogenesis protein [Spongiibacter pelagi]MBD2859030.1 cytochrome c-type biogenesis protein CcmH [Spongiibacter pelagi]
MIRSVIVFLALFFATASWAVIETYQFDNELQQQRYNAFIEELRCPKCQNQNLSGSDSEIAQDLRRQVHSMIMSGKSDIEITQYMLDRYGDFILYRPRFTAGTAVLWLLPAGLLFIGLIIWLRLARRRVNTAPVNTNLSDEERMRLQSILNEPSSDKQEGAK